MLKRNYTKSGRSCRITFKVPAGVGAETKGRYVMNLHRKLRCANSGVSARCRPILLLIGLTLLPVSAEGQSLAYVANGASDTTTDSISVIDTVSNTVVDTIPVDDDGPIVIAIAPDGTVAYVTNFTAGNPGTVFVIDTATNTLVETIQVGTNPKGVAVTPDGAYVYVANRGSLGDTAGGTTVSVIDAGSNTVVETISVGTGPSEVAIIPDGAYAYVTNVRSDDVSVIDTAINTVIMTVPVGNFPVGVAVTPDGAFVYVANNLSNTVSVIEVATNTAVAGVPLAGGARPEGIDITPDGAFAYVTQTGLASVAVIDTVTNTVVQTVPVGNGPIDVAVTPSGAFAYVTNQASNTVSVIAVDTNTVVETIAVGEKPRGVAVTAEDRDGDGVSDRLDVCQGTVIPESVPTERLGRNRWALADEDGIFDTNTPPGGGPGPSFTIADSAGCSCEQVIEAQDLGRGHEKFGCSISAMEDWVALVNP